MTKKNISGQVPHATGDDRVKYAIHNLDLSRVKLSESPLDDYQRLFFATLLSRPNVDQRRNLDVRRVTYKSNIAQSFGCLSSGVAQDAAATKENDAAGTSPKMQGKKALDCFEYQLPDVDTQRPLGYGELSSLPDTFKENLGLKDGFGHLLKGSISGSNEEGVSRNVALPTQSYAPGDNDDRAGNANSLTKNQQFKLRKQDHSLQQNSKLINPNNCVLWTHGSGYVFLTGIWRLCQDVMRGLTCIQRLDDGDSENLQDLCKKELDHIIALAFYEPSSSHVSASSTDRRRRRSSIGTDKGSSLSYLSSSFSPSEPTGTGATSLNPHYTDLHWNSLSRELKQMMCDTYRSYLIVERGLNPQDIPSFDYTDVIKRIRGGYIKIQGTWLPFETAKLLCIRFCYPIRYLLVPIFGPLFPRDCEEWYMSIQSRLQAPVERRSRQELQLLQRRRRKDSAKSRISKPVGNELLNAFQNLLDISKHPIPAESQRMQVRSKSLSCASDYTPLMSRRVSSETLPPISTVMKFVSPLPSAREGSDHVNPIAEPENLHYSYSPSPYRYQSVKPQIHPNPTVQTLSHLASFYNTRGHRYSYPGNVYMSHQKPVFSRAPTYTPPLYEPPEYQTRIPNDTSPQRTVTGLEIPNYKTSQRRPGNTAEWFSGSSAVEPIDDLVSPRSTNPEQITKGDSLIGVYPNIDSYWSGTTR